MIRNPKNAQSAVRFKAIQSTLSALSGRKADVGYLKSNHLNSNSAVTCVCREVACEGLGILAGYCRLHYIKNWKKIKRKEVLLSEKKINQYIEEILLKYPAKYIDAIKQDLKDEKEFAKVISDLDLDGGAIEDFGVDSEDSDSLLDTIKRDFDSDVDLF